MEPTMFNRLHLKPTLLAGTFGLVLSSPAGAQDYGPYGEPAYQAGPGESVEVIAPRLRLEQTPLNGTYGRASLSVPVRYDDLDLRTRHGARELRWRVRGAARDVCANLAGIYPVYQLNGTSCYRTALENALP